MLSTHRLSSPFTLPAPTLVQPSSLQPLSPCLEARDLSAHACKNNLPEVLLFFMLSLHSETSVSSAFHWRSSMNASAHFTKLHNLEFLCCQPHSCHSTVGTRQFFHALCPFEAGLWASGVLPLPSFILWVSQNLFPWLADGYLLATSTHSCPSVCTYIPGVSLCVQISPSYKEISQNPP